MKKLTIALMGATMLMGAVGAAMAQELTVGVSWNNFQEERWKTDEAAMKGVFDQLGVKYVSTDAQSSATKQLSDIEN
jgi:D-xylose transport system substrate-binding protein